MTRPNGDPVRLPDGRCGRWYRVGREEPRALWPGWEWATRERTGDCGRMRAACPRLDQIEQDSGRFG